MIAVSVGDDRALDGPPRVDIEIPGRAIQTFRTRDNKIHVVARMEGLVRYEAGVKPEVLSRCHGAMTFPCGSELARDSGVSVTRKVDWQGLIASKLAPTFVRW
jgi:hypothetical protein